jgi:multidrug efflux pump subunit AcrB
MSLEGFKVRYRSFLFLLLILAVLGLVIAIRLPVTLFPAVDFPRVMVSMETSPRPTVRTAIELTIPVEEVVRRVPGVRNVRSTTSRGKADVNIFFDWNTNMDQAALQINAAIAQIASSLPNDLQLTVKRMDPTSFPILGYSMVSETTSLAALYDIARYQLLPLLFNVNGIADVEIVGGDIDEYQVSFDPAKLDALGITLADLSTALTSSNQVDAVGKLEGNYQLNLVVVDAKLKNIQQISQLPIRISNGPLIPLQDIAKVELATIPGWQRVTADGHDAVIVQVLQQPGSNSVQIAQDVREKLATFRNSLPEGVALSTWYDQSELVQQSANSVLEALVIGVVFAAAVLLFSLRNLRLAIIVAIIIPVSLLVTVVAMYLLNISFNIMSLGGLATGVGLMIDDVIVMSEYIMRKLKAKRKSIWSSAREFFPSLVGSSAATIIIFLPLTLLSGVTGAFFKTLALTISSGLFISFLATWLAVPLLASMLLKDTDAEQEDQPIFKRIQNSYKPSSKRFSENPYSPDDRNYSDSVYWFNGLLQCWQRIYA